MKYILILKSIILFLALILFYFYQPSKGPLSGSTKKIIAPEKEIIIKKNKKIVFLPPNKETKRVPKSLCEILKEPKNLTKEDLDLRRDENSEILYTYESFMNFLNLTSPPKGYDRINEHYSNLFNFGDQYPGLFQIIFKEDQILQNSSLSSERKNDLKLRMKDSLRGSDALRFDYHLKLIKEDYSKNEYKSALDRLEVLTEGRFLDSSYGMTIENLTSNLKTDQEMALALSLLKKVKKPDLDFIFELGRFATEPYHLESLENIYQQIAKFYMSQKDILSIDLDQYSKAYKFLKKKDEYLRPEILVQEKSSVDLGFHLNSGCDERYIRSMCDKFCTR